MCPQDCQEWCASQTESLEQFKGAPLNFLQVLDLSHNRIEEYSINFPMLRELCLNNNQLSAIKLDASVCVLKKLDVRRSSLGGVCRGEPPLRTVTNGAPLRRSSLDKVCRVNPP